VIKNPKFIKVIILLIIVNSILIGLLPGLIYYFLIPIITLITFVVLLWFTNVHTNKKILLSFLPFPIIICLISIWKIYNTVEPETFIIPKFYRGEVRIIFNQKCGNKINYENKRRIYEIPNDGILLTQFQNEEGFINQEFYISNNGKLEEIKELKLQDFNEEWTIEKNPKEPSRDKLAIFSAGTTDSDGNSRFYICTYNELKEFQTNYQMRRDSLSNAKILYTKKYCR